MITENRKQEITGIVKDNFASLIKEYAELLVECHKDPEEGYTNFTIDDFIPAWTNNNINDVVTQLFYILFDKELTYQGEDKLFKQELINHINGKFNLVMDIVKSWMYFFEA